MSEEQEIQLFQAMIGWAKEDGLEDHSQMLQHLLDS